MAAEGNTNNEKKPGSFAGISSLLSVNIRRKEKMVITLLRILAFLGALLATIVMVLNKETKTIVVATIGTTPITLTLAAKFQDTPANIFFVVANGLAALYNLLMLIIGIFPENFNKIGVGVVAVPILDTVVLALVSAGASSAAFMSDLAKHGNSHAQWNKICDKFERFCSHGGGALLASFIAILLLLLISVFPRLKQNNCDITSV